MILRSRRRRPGRPDGPAAPAVAGLEVGEPLVPAALRVPGRPVAWWARDADGCTVLVQRVRPARRGTTAPLAGLDEASLRRALPHPHVLPLVRVTRCAEGPVQVLGPASGTGLADVLRRGPLTAGQVVLLVAALGTALAALHEQGLVHGEVSAAGVVVDGEGVPALVGWGAAQPVAGRRAERRHLERGPADPSADVLALAELALAALAGASARPDGDDRARDHLRSVLEGVRGGVRGGADTGLAAEELARRCWAVAPAEPLVPPGGALAPWPLATGAPVTGARAGRRAAWAARIARRPGRWAALPLTGALVVGAAAVVLAASATTPREVPPAAAASSASPPAPPPATPPATPPAAQAGPAVAAAPLLDARLTGDDPAAAVVALAQLRADALSALDAAALDRVDAPGAPALAADLDALAALGGTRREGLAVLVERAVVVESGGAAGAGGVWLDVVSRTSAHRVLTADGAREVPAGEPVTSRVLLQRVDGAWRVADTA